MPKILIGLVLGFVLGGVVTFLTFVGVPRAAQSPGTPVLAPDPAKGPASAQIVLGQDLFNQILTTIFRDINEPTFPLALNGDSTSGPVYERANFLQDPACDGTIRIKAEGSGVRSGLRLENGRISAPLAFSGSYNSPFGCLQFTGWSQADLELRFDKEKQAVYGRVNVETVNLDGVNPLFGGLITPLVQSTINTRVNPIQIIHPGQLAVDMPVASTGGKLQAVVEDVRAEVKENSLNLYVYYTFSGSPNL
jgi:hypothetical protein